MKAGIVYKFLYTLPNDITVQHAGRYLYSKYNSKKEDIELYFHLSYYDFPQSFESKAIVNIRPVYSNLYSLSLGIPRNILELARFKELVDLLC